jgi:hypothetical protein
MFSAIWLTASGAFMYLGASFGSSPLNSVAAFLLALIGAFVLVPSKKVEPRIGSGVCIGAIFNLVNFLFLVGYERSTVYIPWGILPILLFELVLFVARPSMGFRRAVLISSLTTGAFFGILYYPFTIYFFPWCFSPQPLIFFPITGSLVGALLGNSAYTALSSSVLGDVTAL